MKNAKKFYHNTCHNKVDQLILLKMEVLYMH